MNAVPMPLRVRDIPAPQAEALREIHHLASESSRLRNAASAPGASERDRLERLDEINALDRDRGLLEIRTRADGVPASWVDVARRLGVTRQPWTDAQVLPPQRATMTRRNGSRVALDTHVLVDMAAVEVVRAHKYRHHRMTADPESAEAHQFRRNMSALWQRAVVTANAIDMDPSHRARLIETAKSDLSRRVSAYRDYSLDDIDTLWHPYTSGRLGDEVRSTLRKHPDRNTLGPNAGEDPILPSPRQWLDHARTSLDSDSAAEPGDRIAAAVAAASAELESPEYWDPGIDPHTADLSGPQPSAETGPDP
ncbi:hypothetical protein [Nocardia noduli]|uniref:hypothetical protein n=1 Tax=Nocardia noduli TaxID=2815722 RepID=UPI001C24F7F6|nr:hypothetical protein [Nocardia noduli]